MLGVRKRGDDSIKLLSFEIHAIEISASKTVEKKVCGRIMSQSSPTFFDN